MLSSNKGVQGAALWRNYKKSNEVKEQKKEIGGFEPIRDFGDEKLPFR